MDLDLSKIKNVHFIGIGGIGISAVARMMLYNDKLVTGQDMQYGEVIRELRKVGAQITIGQSYENIPKGTDLIVYTIAIDTYDPDLAHKIKMQESIPIRSYPEMLDVISRDRYTIAVSGTHGKTTTTAMIAQILSDSGQDPTVIVGSLLVGSKSNFLAGQSKYLVVEACEYRRSFLNINPTILVITNIDEDHLDYYKDIEDIKNAFHVMAMKVPEDGYVICNPGDNNIADILVDVKARIIDWQTYLNLNLKLKVPGLHNKKDAAAAVAVAAILGISKESAEKYVGAFPGTWRRFEFKGKLKNEVLIYDDYAHHPTEIMATLEGFRELYPKDHNYRVMVIFQPHLFSRTKLLLADFAQSFQGADRVILLPIYYAREVDDGSISSAILATEINKYSNNALFFNSFPEVENYVQNLLPTMNHQDIIITMGAGDAFKIGDFLFNLNHV